MGELNFCITRDILKAAYEQVTTDQALDIGTPRLLIRLLHNKIFGLMYAAFHCYLLYFDTLQLATFVSIFLIPFIVVALFFPYKRKLIWAIQLVMPVFFIINPLKFSLSQRIHTFQGFYIFLGVVGVLKVVRMMFIKKLKKLS
jgi:hypothetical protein